MDAWRAVRPTSSRSVSLPPARSTFWTVVKRGAGGSFAPEKYGLSGCMPAETKSVERSSGGGTSGHEGKRLWPRSSKNERNPSRSSAVVRTRPIVGAPGWRLARCFAGARGLFVRGDLGADLLQRPPDQARHVHLRDADLRGDLRLRQPFEEP